MRSTPIWRAARSISRSIANIASGRPALRYGLVGGVLVSTARARMCATGTRYTEVSSSEHLTSGTYITLCAPVLQMTPPRSARMRPPASSASSASIAWSRPW